MADETAAWVYQFEEIGSELARPPFAALRALQSVGILVTPKGWQHLDLHARQTLVTEGQRERVDILAVRTIANAIPANQIKLVSRSVDPSATEVPADLLRALGPQRAIPVAEWTKLSNLDRFTLVSLTYNTRLLWRALDELERKSKLQRRRGAWAGAVARCELKTRSEVLVQIMGTEFLDGRALVLARGAGRRAARKASELFDLQSDTEAGPVELDWGILDQPGHMLWQAHVSGWDGAFLPAASLQAALTAAVAIFDMIKELDPKATLSFATITEEPWLVGNDGPADIATRLYAKPAKSLATQSEPAKVPNDPPAPPPKRGETMRLETSPLHAVPRPPPAAVSPAAASPPAPSPSKPTHTPPAAVQVPNATPSKPVQRLSVPPQKSAQGTFEETVQINRIKSDQRPLIAALILAGLAGAGVLGYMLGR